MSEPQLERSVLEAKEREELFAIATALGTNPIARARKSDLVGQILRATGIEGEEAPAETKPRRTRARKAAVAAEVAEPLPLGDPSAPSHEAPPATEPAGAGRAPRTDGADRLAVPGGVIPPAPADPLARPGSATPPASADPSVPPAGADGTARSAPPDRAGRPAGGEGAARAGDDPDRTDAAGRRQVTQSRRAAAAPVRSDEADRDDGQRADQDRPRTAPDGGHDPARSGAGNGGQARRNPRRDERAGRSGPASEPAPSAVGSDGEGAAPSPSGGDDSGNQRFEESGNRRSRRRRGRDRSERVERDLSGQVTDQPFNGEPTPVSGYLDLREEGYGFLRSGGHLAGPDDVYVSISQVRRFGLRRGDHLDGASRPAGGNEKYPALLRLDRVSGGDPDLARDRPVFEDLLPAFPDRLLRVATTDPPSPTGRLVELVTPIGAGQRVLLSAPPRSGRRTFVRELATALDAANPDVEVIVVVIDERPEEIAELRRAVDAEVVATAFDRPADEHVAVADLVIERAKRRAELGADVVVVFDGLTRFARSYNLAQPATGRALAGGIDTGALNPPKRLFGAARNIEDGGSLTIVATALTETGSRMDEVIYDELRDTANAEIRLSHDAASQRVFPAVDLDASSTRHEERLVDADRLERLRTLRASLLDPATGTAGVAGLDRLVGRIHSTADNDELLAGS